MYPNFIAQISNTYIQKYTMTSSTSRKKKKRSSVNLSKRMLNWQKNIDSKKKKATSPPANHIITNEIIPFPSHRRKIDLYYKIRTDRLSLSFLLQTSLIDNIMNMMAQIS